MGANSKIEWTHHTFNPWVGCTKVSAACDHCYAEGWAKRTGQSALWQGERRRTSASNWKLPLKWNKAAQAAGERHRVFCASLADVFDNQVPVDWRNDLWELIASTRQLDWLLLTKRPQNIEKMLPVMDTNLPGYKPWNECWPWNHVWLGATVENQHEANMRIPHLLRTPAAVRFLSCEPMLGPINLRRVLTHGGWYDALEGWRDVSESPAPEGVIDWVICGGESGSGARPMHPDWARSLRDQCKKAGTAFHFKQWGEWASSGPWMLDQEIDIENARIALKPNQQLMEGGIRDGRTLLARVGKKNAGRQLDGLEHNAFPTSI